MTHIIKTLASVIALTIAVPAFAEDTTPPRPDPLNQMRAEHIMISTDDFEETLTWYRDVLGFEVAQRWTVPEFPGLELGYLEKNGFVIEVVETPEARESISRPSDLGEALNDRVIGHFAFLVADVDAVAEELRRRGAEFMVEPTSYLDAGRRLIFIYDNNGYVIEFLTPLSAYEARSTQ